MEARVIHLYNATKLLRILHEALHEVQHIVATIVEIRLLGNLSINDFQPLVFTCDSRTTYRCIVYVNRFSLENKLVPSGSRPLKETYDSLGKTTRMASRERVQNVDSADGSRLP